jgi:SAM-dependent methyltransferase
MGKLLRWRAPRVLDRDEAYRLWAPGYPPEPHNALMRAEQRVVLAALGNVRGCAALDVGTGSGRYARLLRARGAHRVVGVDRSMAMMTAHAPATRGAIVVRGDACALPLRDDAFDAVVAGLVVGDIASLDAWLAEARRVLRPGGRLVYSDLNERWTRSGWNRTFRSGDGREHVLPYVPRSSGEHLAGLAAAGLTEARALDVVLAETDVGGADAATIVAMDREPVGSVFTAIRPARSDHGSPDAWLPGGA